MLKVIVAAGRDFQNYDLFSEKLNKLFANRDDVVIVPGMTGNADSLAAKYASEHQLRVSEFPPNLVKFQKPNGFRRNVEMARFADACVCFWNGKSEGTKHMIDTAKRYNLNLRIIKY